MITPINKCLLIELKGKYNNIQSSEEKFNTSKSRGSVVAIAEDCLKDALALGIEADSTVYFNQYEDNCTFKENGHDYALIELEKMKGVENEPHTVQNSL